MESVPSQTHRHLKDPQDGDSPSFAQRVESKIAEEILVQMQKELHAKMSQNQELEAAYKAFQALEQKID